MALTVTKDSGNYGSLFTPKIYAKSDLKFLSGKFDFDDSYPTGGESLDLSAHFKTLLGVFITPRSGYVFDYDYTAKKVKAMTPVNAAVAHSHVNTLALTAKTLRLVHAGSDIKGSANTDAENADQAALPTNGALVVAEAAVAAGAWTPAGYANPDMGRNVCIAVHNDSGGSLDLFEGVSTFTITGTYRGAAQVETITITSTGANKAVANTKFRYKYGVKPFDTVTAAAVDNEPADGLKIAVGLGSKIGLPTDLKTPAEADVVKITKNAANLAPAGIVDTTNMTVNLGALADGDDLEIVYEGVAALTNVVITNVTGGAISAAAAAEVANTTNLATLTGVRFLAWGY